MPNQLPEIGDRVNFPDTMREGDFLTCIQLTGGGRRYRREDGSTIELSDIAVLNSRSFTLVKPFGEVYPTRFDRGDPI